MKNVVIFFGGKSSEHNISIITGVLAVNGTDKSKYNAIPIYIRADGTWWTGEGLNNLKNFENLSYKGLKRVTFIGGDNCLYSVCGKKVKNLGKIALALNCLHGINGEDGSLAGVVNMCGIPLASPNLLGSAVSMDKGVAKDIVRTKMIKTLKHVSVNSGEYYKDTARVINKVLKRLSFPMIIKPSALGSSIGITVADDEVALKKGIENAFKYGDSLIIEPKLTDFVEINCACYMLEGKLQVSEPELVATTNSILTFADKYLESSRATRSQGVDSKLARIIKGYTKSIYSALKMQGVIRIDYLVKDGVVYFNEINSVPGSLAYYFFMDSTLSLPDFLNGLYQTALVNANKKEYLLTEYQEGSLFNGIKGKYGKK